jgi:isopentenyl-diphosphate delta-isomerase
LKLQPASVEAEGLIPAIAGDGRLFPIGKLEAHRRGVFHLAISVFVFCQNSSKLLIQRRAAGKYHSGGQWANTCCTHPAFGEDVVAAAERRLAEELGLHLVNRLGETAVLEYRAAVGNGLIEHERVHVFRSSVDQQTLALSLNQDEVSEVAWVAPDDLKREAARSPSHFTPWLCIYLDRWAELRLD